MAYNIILWLKSNDSKKPIIIMLQATIHNFNACYLYVWNPSSKSTD